MLRDNLVGLIEPMLSGAGAYPLALRTNRKQSSDDRPVCLENPRPAGAESTLTENVASPFHAEPGQDVVQEHGEPLFSILSCYLTYPLERARRTFPALSPECVTLGRVSLGQLPSLHRLRCRSLGLVRRLRRYCRAVRLPTSVHHRRTSFDFPMRPVALSATGRRGISRFPHKVLAYM